MDTEMFVVTLSGSGARIEVAERANSSGAASMQAYAMMRLFPVRVEPIMAHLARTAPAFTDELLETIYGRR